ncbi:alpha/beta fold hydrolase [Pseudogemmobacter humi]|uniref:Alpha/beta hydrolase family protein n=1 Tax=Pseudogemmobacter humi TaxID=2483812 RepID=A0A3P5X939_9RHOB|nr:alpha/beta hydrolase [Pseudogemmobacter humi]VDC27317.1 Alpha/beta hydrolase family protein [Pseudogemmobacter humi]
MTVRIIHRLIAVLAVFGLLAGCGPRDLPVAAVPSVHPVAGPQAAPRRITYLLPGALSTSRIFGPLRAAAGPDHLVMEYRFPGLQDQPVDPPMRIARVAQEIADHAARHPGAELEILAFSTGGAIALEAAGRIGPGRKLRVVILSGATPVPGAYDSALRGSLALAAAVLATGSLEARTVWGEYYKTLLYGYGWRRDPAIRRKAEAQAARDRKNLILPVKGLGRAHTRDLLGWRLSPAARTSGAAILFLHGGRDPVFPVAGVAALARETGATLCVLPGGGHLLMTTHPRILGRAGDFLAGRWQGEECRAAPEGN